MERREWLKIMSAAATAALVPPVAGPGGRGGGSPWVARPGSRPKWSG